MTARRCAACTLPCGEAKTCPACGRSTVPAGFTLDGKPKGQVVGWLKWEPETKEEETRYD